ncbi:hypothetical protein WDV91_07830 [Curtobacterium flaccumfaciens pv. flaccumfaciens]
MVSKNAASWLVAVWRSPPAEAHDADRADHDDDPGCTTTCEEGDRSEQDEWPDDVELLLDRERPEVLHRGGDGIGVEVADRLGGEEPVLGEQRRGEHVRARRRPGRCRQQEHREHQDRDQHDDRGGRQPSDPACVEPDEHRDRLFALGSLQDVTGDQEAGDDEEDVDAHVPAGDPVRPEVVQDDQGDGDRSDPLDVGSESSLGPIGPVLRTTHPAMLPEPRSGP